MMRINSLIFLEVLLLLWLLMNRLCWRTSKRNKKIEKINKKKNNNNSNLPNHKYQIIVLKN